MKCRQIARSRACAPWARAGTVAAAALGLGVQDAQAQELTRIVAATVFPDSARVDRELKVPGGTRHITIACLPTSVDVTTLQVDGDADVRVGDLRATDLPASRSDECAPATAQARRDALAQQRDSLESQRDANDLGLTYLRTWSAPADADANVPARVPAGATHPGATASDLRRAALDLLGDQARVKRALAALAREEARAADDLPQAKGKTGWRTVRFDVWTPAQATLRVHYSVVNTYWRPTYRAALDTARSTLRLDRQADIVQASGEDWSDVRVTLSTRQARRRVEAETPTPWWLDLVAVARSLAGFGGAPAPSARMEQDVRASSVAATAEPAAASVEPPPWDVQTTQGEGATEFTIGQGVSLPSDGQSHTLQIASQSLPVTLKRRTTPRTNGVVYLLAQATRPAGVWPAGPLQAWQDGTLAGRSDWQPAEGEKFEIAMGQDDLMRVDVESPGTFTQAKGVFGGSVERAAATVYAIVNRHPAAVTVEMLDAAPVSRNDAIKVSHLYEPLPLTTEWNKLPGVAAWTLNIPAQGTSRVRVTHTVTAPKGAVVANLP